MFRQLSEKSSFESVDPLSNAGKLIPGKWSATPVRRDVKPVLPTIGTVFRSLMPVL